VAWSRSKSARSSSRRRCRSERCFCPVKSQLPVPLGRVIRQSRSRVFQMNDAQVMIDYLAVRTNEAQY
jgi:hypothetical protein